MKNFLVVCFILVSANITLLAGNMDGLLDSAKKIMADSQNSQALELLKVELKKLEDGLVKDKAIEAVALSLLKSDQSSFDQFKAEYPNFDFSKVSGDGDLKKVLSHLILNSISESEVSEGRSPVSLAVEINGDFDAPAQVPEIDASSQVDSIASVEEQPVSPEMKDPAVVTSVQQETPVVPLGKSEIATESVYYKVYQVAKKAQEGDSQAIKDMLKMSLVETGDEEVNGMLIKTITLAMVNSNSKSLKAYMGKVESNFPDGAYLQFLEEDPFQANCNRCAGKGAKETPCRKCTGGKCRNCKGKKEISYKGLGGETVRKECPACKATGNCISCEGTSIHKSPCRSCNERGIVFAKAVVPQEYAKSLQNILDLMPKLADDNGLYIGVGIDRLALARKEQEERQKEEKRRLMAEMVRKRKEDQRLAKLEKEKEAREKEKEMTSDGDSFVREVAMEDFEEGGTNATLKHALLEVTQYLDAQEKRTKGNIYESADAKFVNSFPTLLLEVSEEVSRLDADTKFQYLDGFFQFWKLRCGQNRLGRTVGFVATHKGKKIAEMKKNEVVLLP